MPKILATSVGEDLPPLKALSPKPETPGFFDWELYNISEDSEGERLTLELEQVIRQSLVTLEGTLTKPGLGPQARGHWR